MLLTSSRGLKLVLLTGAAIGSAWLGCGPEERNSRTSLTTSELTFVSLVPARSVWRYLDTGADPGPSWKALSFDHTAWRLGRAELGYGDGDEATKVRFGSTSSRYITTYFRRPFTIAPGQRFGDLVIRLRRDDGAVVYVNGVEVFRSNMPSGTITRTTLASTALGGAAELAYVEKTLSADVLQSGNNVVAVEVHQSSASSPDLSFDLELRATELPPADGGVETPTTYGTLVSKTATWRFLDTGADLGTLWRATSFNDSSWPSGPAELGYGDGDEATVVSFGPSSTNKFVTTYFRHSFQVSNPATIPELILNVLEDDGVVVYLNGAEIYRHNMPTGVPSYRTRASTSLGGNAETAFRKAQVPPSLLLAGTNVIAAEVHQNTVDSSDLSFALELATPPAPQPPPPPPPPDAGVGILLPAGSGWAYLDNGSNPGSSWTTATFNDSAWQRGNAQLGYGDGDEVTTVSFGADASQKRITTYFRNRFQVADATQVGDLMLRLLRDDGAIVYVNGTEIYRSNMPTDVIQPSTLAAVALGPPEENAFLSVRVRAPHLLTGENVIAVEVHQASADSSDLGFDLEVSGLAPAAPIPPGDGGTEILVGAGDISDCGTSQDHATAALLDSIPGVVFTAGDNAYENGTLDEYNQCYGPTWGRHKARTIPVVGNHEYHTPGASDHFAYFGPAAGDPSRGYFSRRVGSWQVLVLNSNCDEVGGCYAGSPQETWLRNQLSQNPSLCTLALWHHPTFSSGDHGSNEFMADVWEALYQAGAEIVISGHDHHYERFAPQTTAGLYDPVFGVTQFVVGTGGRHLYPLNSPLPNSLVAQGTDHGVLKLTLAPDGYSWEFVPIAGATFTDRGSGRCH